jgi:hypothetical protein
MSLVISWFPLFLIPLDFVLTFYVSAVGGARRWAFCENFSFLGAFFLPTLSPKASLDSLA